MEQAIQAAVIGNVEKNASNPIASQKLVGAFDDKDKEKNHSTADDAAETNTSVPFFQLLNQQMVQGNTDFQKLQALVKSRKLQNISAADSGTNTTLASLQDMLQKNIDLLLANIIGQGNQISIDSNSVLKNDAGGTAGNDGKEALAMTETFDPNVKAGDASKLIIGEDKITPTDDAASQNKFKSEITDIEAQLQENLQEKATQVVLNQKPIQSGKAILEAEQTAGKMAILGELSDKNILGQKNDALAGDTKIDELSFSLISGSDTGSKNIDKTNDISPEGIINQITSELKGNAVSDGSRVRITLNPPSLGTLEMDVTVRNNRVEIVIVADNKDVQQILNNHIDQLKGSLQTQGLKIERCDVLMQGNREDYRQNLGQHAFHHNGSGEGSNRRQDNSEENFKLNVTATAKHQDNVLKASTDNISLFA